MSRNRIIKLTDDIYQIKYYWLGLVNVYFFLVVGEERALLIDTAHSTTGAGDYAASLTSLPVDVVNTHGHFDHIGGNAEFEQVYLSRADWAVAAEHANYDYLMQMQRPAVQVSPPLRLLLSVNRVRQDLEQSLHVDQTHYVDLPAAGCFDLGGRTVHILETPGHTRGSICLFDDRSGYLFTGDMLCSGGVLLSFDHSTSVSEYRDSVNKIRQFYWDNGGKRLVPSHHLPVQASIMDRSLELCDRVISGDLKGKPADTGVTAGLRVFHKGLRMIYREI